METLTKIAARDGDVVKELTRQRSEEYGVDLVVDRIQEHESWATVVWRINP